MWFTMMMMIFDKANLVLLAASRRFNLQSRNELMRLRQFIAGFQIFVPADKPEFLFGFMVSQGLDFHFGARWFYSMTMIVKKIEAKTWRHLCLEYTEFDAAVFGSDKWSA